MSTALLALVGGVCFGAAVTLLAPDLRPARRLLASTLLIVGVWGMTVAVLWGLS